MLCDIYAILIELIVLLLQGASAHHAAKFKIAAMEYNKPVALRKSYQC